MGTHSQTPVDPDEATSAGAAALHPVFRVAVPTFEGPLDLLLHLIREHRIDIFDIPIALIAEKYNQSIAEMAALDLDVAGEFLVMAATLTHIKSRLLLPRTEVPSEAGEAAEEQGDPRAELVRRLLEYQKYKDVARQLAENPLLDRDVFARRITPAAAAQVESAALAEVSVYRLIEALDRVLKALEPRVGHEVVRDQLTLSAAMQGITGRLRPGERVSFFQLFEGRRNRGSVVVTFLALLEMVKLRLVRIHQDDGARDIWVTQDSGALEGGAPEVDEREYS
ncbi:MAG TPA: segregation/condensation protein A [Myxococcaceae bacterium]|nr:segregation/condensation protein A [Myxococcaceae bacterium]